MARLRNHFVLSAGAFVLILVIGNLTAGIWRRLRPYLANDSLARFPRVFLWVWERPEDLEFLDPRAVGVAVLAKTLTMEGPEIRGYATAQCHRIRLLLESGRNDQARAALDELLPALRASLASSSLTCFWRNARETESRRFAAVLLMLHFPGMSPFIQSGAPRRKQLAGIDNFKENWWCGLGIEGDPELPAFVRFNMSRDWSSPSKFKNRQRRPEPSELPAFLTASEKTAFRGEWNKLGEVETASNFLGRIVLSWAAKHRQDTRVPEALYFVVRAGRYGCNDADTWRYSRDAFGLLHKRYGESEWARMTKYWYR